MRLKFATLACLALAVPAIAHAGDVKVDLKDVRAGGTVYVQLQTREQFMTGARAYGEMVKAPPAGPLSLTLKDVAPGEYAISVWHDDNGNERFDLDPNTGRPMDGIAVPNSEALYGPPRFDDVKTRIGTEAAAIALSMLYGR